jgi:uncharacterized OB-fold protein
MKLIEIIISNAERGILITTYCFNCKIYIWPPNYYCNSCLKKTGFRKISRRGILLEKSLSNLPDSLGYYGIGEFSGIRVIGSVDQRVVPEDRIRISHIGIKNNKLNLEFSKMKFKK